MWLHMLVNNEICAHLVAVHWKKIVFPQPDHQHVPLFKILKCSMKIVTQQTCLLKSYITSPFPWRPHTFGMLSAEKWSGYAKLVC